MLFSSFNDECKLHLLLTGFIITMYMGIILRVCLNSSQDQIMTYELLVKMGSMNFIDISDDKRIPHLS